MNRIASIRHTLSVLTANLAVDRDTVNLAYNQTLKSERVDNEFCCPIFGNRALSFNAAVNLADILVRSGRCPELLAAISAGRVGTIAAIMAAKRVQYRKTKSGNEQKIHESRRFESLRTSCGVEKNMLNEIPAVKSLSLGLLFNSEQRFARIAPFEVVEIDTVAKYYMNFGGKPKSRCFVVTGKTNDGEVVKYTMKTESEKVVRTIKSIVSHNRETKDIETVVWVQSIVTVNEKNFRFGMPIEQIKQQSIIRAAGGQEYNLFLGAFQFAATNWISFEGFSNPKTTEYMTDSLNEKRDWTPEPWDVPTVHINELREAHRDNKTIQIILSECDGGFTINQISHRAYDTVSRSAFYRALKELKATIDKYNKKD